MLFLSWPIFSFSGLLHLADHLCIQVCSLFAKLFYSNSRTILIIHSTILLTPLSIFGSFSCQFVVVFWLVFFACLLIIFSSNPRILLAPGLNVQQKVDKLFAAAHSWPGNTQDRPTTPLDIRINGLEAEKLQCCDFYDICRNDNVLYVCTWESH